MLCIKHIEASSSPHKGAICPTRCCSQPWKCMDEKLTGLMTLRAFFSPKWKPLHGNVSLWLHTLCSFYRSYQLISLEPLGGLCWVTKKYFLHVCVFPIEFGLFCTAERKNDIHFSQSDKVFILIWFLTKLITFFWHCQSIFVNISHLKYLDIYPIIHFYLKSYK